MYRNVCVCVRACVCVCVCVYVPPLRTKIGKFRVNLPQDKNKAKLPLRVKRGSERTPMSWCNRMTTASCS